MDFVLTLHSHLPYVLNHGRWPHGTDWITEAAIDTYLPLIDALHARTSLRGLFLIVDARRGLTEGDAGLLEWAAPEQRVHVLLSKADKLSRAEADRALRTAADELAGRATLGLFSATEGTGVREAQETLLRWLE